MPIPAKSLVPTQTVVHKVLVGSLISQADHIMREYGFKQVPVVDAEGKPKGLVTHAQISSLMSQHGQNVAQFDVEAAMNETAIFPAEMDIFSLLDSLNQPSAILLTDAAGQLVNIITNRDTANFFRQRAEEILLIEFIETTLKKHLSFYYQHNPDALQKEVDDISGSYEGNRKKIAHSLNLLKQAVSSVFVAKEYSISLDGPEMHQILENSFPQSKEIGFDDLSLDGFISMLLKKWDVFSITFKYTKDAWYALFEDVRKVRNKVFHFKGQVSNIDRNQLRVCAKWLEKVPLPMPASPIVQE